MAHTKLSTFLAILSTLSFTACVEPESTDDEFPEFEADDPTTADDLDAVEPESMTDEELALIDADDPATAGDREALKSRGHRTFVMQPIEDVAVDEIAFTPPDADAELEGLADPAGDKVSIACANTWAAASVDIENKYFALGGSPVMGNPITPVEMVWNGTGFYRWYSSGKNIYRNCAAGTHQVGGAILGRWWEFDLEQGFLGWPTTSETATPDGVGRYNHFQGGSIYWKPSIGAHEVHGLIRGLWASLGWETNPGLGYPISNELPTGPGSPHRFNDFENGVVAWTSGSGTATKLNKFVLGTTASLTKAQLAAKVNDQITAMLPPEAYIATPAAIIGVSDYEYWGDTVFNRTLTVRVGLRYHADLLGIDFLMPNPSTTLDVYIEFWNDPGASAVRFTVWGFDPSTDVDFPTSLSISEEEIDDMIAARLDPMYGVTQTASTYPAGLRVVSVKSQRNGDLDVFVGP
jgi:hypothetical protein